MLGREPSFIAHATEAVWELAEHRSLYIEKDAERAGRAILVDDLDARVADIASRSLDPDERVTYSNGARKAIYRDLDGNKIVSARGRLSWAWADRGGTRAAPPDRSRD